MAQKKASKTIQEINAKIKQGKAVVVTADEMADIVKKKGPKKAAREIDVVTTGTFAPMCSSGAFINFGHTKPTTKASRVWLNGVQAYAGLAAVDVVQRGQKVLGPSSNLGSPANLYRSKFSSNLPASLPRAQRIVPSVQSA